MVGVFTPQNWQTPQTRAFPPKEPIKCYQSTADSDPPLGKFGAAVWTWVLAFDWWRAGEMEWFAILRNSVPGRGQQGLGVCVGGGKGGVREVVEEGQGEPASRQTRCINITHGATGLAIAYFQCQTEWPPRLPGPSLCGRMRRNQGHW